MTAKRIVDVLIGSVFAALALPLVGLLAVLLFIELRTSPFFIQQRVGRNGRPFRIPKLRTLPRDVHPYTSKAAFRQADLPPLSRFLRQSHLDELPQLLLVPFGRMSLVGPRPKMPDWAEPIDSVHGFVRTRIRPGCTGLWQVSRDVHSRVADCPDYDYYYVRNACLRLDLWILWRTLLLFVGSSEGISLAHVPRWASPHQNPWPIPLGIARTSIRRAGPP